ncbi:MAG: serine hydrolase domain-containing protein [Pirellulaceae bacterium]
MNIYCRGYLTLACGLFVTLPAPGQDLPTSTPRQLHVSAVKLQQGVQLFRDAIAEDRLRNVELMVLRDGHIILHEALGWQNKSAGDPLQRHTLFRMASNTKSVIATGIQLLQQDGKLSVHDRVGRYLPAFRNEKCRDITISHLLTHTSGFRISSLFLKPLMEKSSQHPDAPNLQLEVNRFAEIGPRESVGETYRYNNPGYNILGALIEVVSDQPLETFLVERIYRPLSMVDTTNHPPADKLDRMAYVYARKDGTWSVRFKQETRMHTPFVRASGGLVSTTQDYARFCQLYLDRGVSRGEQFLTAASVTAATSPHTREIYSAEAAAKIASFYGFGWKVDRDGSFSHGGSEGTFAWVDPQLRIIGLVFTQSPGGDNPRDAFRQLVTEACHRLPSTRSSRRLWQRPLLRRRRRGEQQATKAAKTTTTMPILKLFPLAFGPRIRL